MMAAKTVLSCDWCGDEIEMDGGAIVTLGPHYGRDIAHMYALVSDANTIQKCWTTHLHAECAEAMLRNKLAEGREEEKELEPEAGDHPPWRLRPGLMLSLLLQHHDIGKIQAAEELAAGLGWLDAFIAGRQGLAHAGLAKRLERATGIPAIVWMRSNAANNKDLDAGADHG